MSNLKEIKLVLPVSLTASMSLHVSLNFYFIFFLFMREPCGLYARSFIFSSDALLLFSGCNEGSFFHYSAFLTIRKLFLFCQRFSKTDKYFVRIKNPLCRSINLGMNLYIRKDCWMCMLNINFHDCLWIECADLIW